MKVLILSPPNTFHANRGEGSMDNRIVPLDLATIGAVLEPGNEVRIIDALALGMGKDNVVTAISDYSPDLLLLSPFDRCRWAYDPAREILKEVKTGKIGLIGGYNPDFVLRVMREEKKLTFATYGDPEETLKEIANKGRFSGIRGTIYRSGSKAVKAKPRDFLDIDKLPVPKREMLDLGIYARFPHENKSDNVMDIMVSRGCPYRCSYCLVKQLYGEKYRVRSPENVTKEIRMLLEKYGTREFHFMDPVFTLKADWVERLCELLEPLRIEWSCQTRVDLVSEKILRKMRKAGCFSILYGAETLSPELLRNIRKGATPEQAKRAVMLTKEAGIEARLSFMFGLPGETPEIAEKIVDTVIEMNPDFVQFHSLVIFPGTAIEHDIQRNKWGKAIDKVAIRQFDIVGKPFVPTGYMDRQEIEEMRKRAYRRFYLRPGYILRLLGKPSRFWRYLKAFGIFRSLMKE